MIPLDAVRDAPVSSFCDVTVIVVTPAAVACETLVAPLPANLKSPAPKALAPVANLVTVSVSTLATEIVLPACDTVTFVPPVIVVSPVTNVPAAPPFNLVIVSTELYVIVGSPFPSTP